MAHTPQHQPLVQLGERLGELVEILMLASVDIDVFQRQLALAYEGGKSLSESRHRRADGAKSRRIEAAAVAQHRAHLLILPGRHLLEHVQLAGDQLQCQARAAEETQRTRAFLAHEQRGCLGGLRGR